MPGEDGRALQADGEARSPGEGSAGAEAPGQPRETDILDVELGPEDLEAAPPILEVELEPEGEEGGRGAGAAASASSPAGPPQPYPAPPPPPTQLLPPLDEELLAVAQAERLGAVCARTRLPFVLLVRQLEPQRYEILAAEPLPPGTSVGQPSAGGRALYGTFSLGRYAGCPHCHATSLVHCGGCGTIHCDATDEETGQRLPCPICGNTGPLVPGPWTVRTLAKGKGKTPG
jgi:hypothetical protein